MNDTEPADPWGVPTREVFERLGRAIEDDAGRAVATVVGVDGSAYRPPGAKMLLGDDGSTYGGITAGCLEGPLREVAREVYGVATLAPSSLQPTIDLTSSAGRSPSARSAERGRRPRGPPSGPASAPGA